MTSHILPRDHVTSETLRNSSSMKSSAQQNGGVRLFPHSNGCVKLYTGQPGTVTPVIQPGGVTPTIQPDKVTPAVKPREVTPTIQQGGMTPTIQPEEERPIIRPGEVTPAIKPGEVAPTIHPGSVTSTVQTGEITPTIQQGEVTPTFQPGPTIKTGPTAPAIQLNGEMLQRPNGVIKEDKESVINKRDLHGVMLPKHETNGDIPHICESEDRVTSSGDLPDIKREWKGKGLVNRTASPKGQSWRPNGTVTFADVVDRGPDRKESPSPGTARPSLFKEAVKRHFGKDRLFNLVKTLLNSVEEEKEAHRDLIDSFETARKIQVPVYTPPPAPHSATHRPKRIRRRSLVPLADKIKQDRLESRRNSLIEPGDIAGIIEPGLECKVGGKEQGPGGIAGGTDPGAGDKPGDSKPVSGDIAIKGEPSPGKDTDSEKHKPDDNECVAGVHDGSDNGEANTDNTASSLKGSDQESKEDTRPYTEKVTSRKGKSSKASKVKFKSSDTETVCEEETDSGVVDETYTNDKQDVLDETPVETKVLDQLVLESVLSSPGGDNSESKRKLPIEPGIVIEVESSSNSELSGSDTDDEHKVEVIYHIETELDPLGNYKGECVIELSGTTGAMAKHDGKYRDRHLYNYVEVEDLGEDDSDTDLKYLNEKVACISTVEYESKPKTKLRSTLGPIAEAENSAGSLHNRTYDSSENCDVKCSQQVNEASDESYTDTPRYRNKPKPAVKSDTDSHQTQGIQLITDDENVNYVRKRRTIRSKKRDNKEPKKKQSPSKILSIDIMDVYIGNKDLQRIDSREGGPRTRKRTKNASPRIIKSPRTKVVKHTKHKRNIDMVTLPPALSKSPRSGRAISCTSTRSAPELNRRTEIVEFYRSYQSRKDMSRYEKPESVLWDRLGLSDRCKSAMEQYGEPVEDGDDTERLGSSALLGRPREEPNTCKVWDMPIYEAVKRVKSAKNVPKPRDVEDEAPKHVRVQQMYAHLKKIRRGTGYTSCKPLVSLGRKPGEFRA